MIFHFILLYASSFGVSSTGSVSLVTAVASVAAEAGDDPRLSPSYPVDKYI